MSKNLSFAEVGPEYGKSASETCQGFVFDSCISEADRVLPEVGGVGSGAREERFSEAVDGKNGVRG